ncbi:MAG: hypothetical protein L7H18_02435 [Candidatus Nealsonbacteria bacterium DGGOD1a]|nr:MAG: hypothetical protein L7H18_02435 [Candidatus Nealsonbacteria bacterium DGGOD1a]
MIFLATAKIHKGCEGLTFTLRKIRVNPPPRRRLWKTPNRVLIRITQTKKGLRPVKLNAMQVYTKYIFTNDEFFAAEKWKLQLKLIRQQTL